MAGSWKSDFHFAVANQNAEAMRKAIAKGLPLKRRVFGFGNELTPLQNAIQEGAGAAVVEVLIAAGADVNVPVIENKEEMGSPLCLAAQTGDLRVVRLLIAAGADVNYKNKIRYHAALQFDVREEAR